jgi:hypothetical protein
MEELMLGKVRQVDVFAAEASFQIILNSEEGEELVAVGDDPRGLSIVEASMILGKLLAVEYTPGTQNIISRLTLSV